MIITIVQQVRASRARTFATNRPKVRASLRPQVANFIHHDFVSFNVQAGNSLDGEASSWRELDDLVGHPYEESASEEDVRFKLVVCLAEA